MIHLFVGILLMCSSLGAVISKTNKEFGFRKQREHTEPLKLD